MTKEEKKRYLGSYRLQQAKIGRITEILNSSPKNPEYYQDQLREAMSTRERIEKDIFAVGDELLAEILLQKYTCGRSLAEIAIALNYSTRQTERLHTRALERFCPRQ